MMRCCVFEPLAVHIYRRFLRGESVEKLAAELEIPIERIERRIRAAEKYCERRRHAA